MSSEPVRGAARLDPILEALPDAVLVVNCNGTVVSANRAALGTFQSPGTGLIGRGLLSLLPTFDPSRIPGSPTSRMERPGGPTVGQRSPAVRTDGSEFPCEVSSSLTQGGPGSSAGEGDMLVLVVRDLSDSVSVSDSAEAELRRQQKQTEMILRAAGEGIVGVDREGRVVLVNPAATRILGFRASRLGGQPLLPLIAHSRPDGSPQPPEETALFDTLQTGRRHRVREAVLWNAAGEPVDVEVCTAPVREDENLVGAVMAFGDRSQLVEQDRRIAELEGRNERLTAVMEVELQSALARIHHQLADLATDAAAALWPEANRVLKHLAGESSRVSRMVSDMIAHQQLESGREPLDRHRTAIDKVLNDAVSIGVQLVGAGRARFAVHTAAFEVVVDADRLAQALGHLIADTVRAQDPSDLAQHASAEMRMLTQNGLPTSAQVVIAAAQRGENARIEVRGPALNSDSVHIPLARAVIEAHGGVLQAHELPDGGCTYVVELAIVPPEGTDPDRPVREARAARNGGVAALPAAGARPEGPGYEPVLTPALTPALAVEQAPGAGTDSGSGSGSGSVVDPHGITHQLPLPVPQQAAGRVELTGGRPAALPAASGPVGQAGQVPVDPRGLAGVGPFALPAGRPVVPSGVEAEQDIGTGAGRRARRHDAEQQPEPARTDGEFTGPDPTGMDRIGTGQFETGAFGTGQFETGQFGAESGGEDGAEGPSGGSGRRRRARAEGGPGADGSVEGRLPAQQAGEPAGAAEAASPQQRQRQHQSQPQPQGLPHDPRISAGLDGGPVGAPRDIGRDSRGDHPIAVPQQHGVRPQLGPVQARPVTPPGSFEVRSLGDPQAAGGESTFGRGFEFGEAQAGGAQAGDAQSGGAPPADGSSGERFTDDGPGSGSHRRTRHRAPEPEPDPRLDVGPYPSMAGGMPGGVPGEAAAPGPDPRVRMPAPEPVAPTADASIQLPGQVGGGGPETGAGGGAGAATGAATGAGIPGRRRRALQLPDGSMAEPAAPAQAPAPAPSTSASPLELPGPAQLPAASAPAVEPSAAALDDTGAIDLQPAPVAPAADGRPRGLLVWPTPDPSTHQALTERGFSPDPVSDPQEVLARAHSAPAALFVDPLTGPITRTALQALRDAAVVGGVPVLVTAGLGQATREAVYGADPAVLLQALGPRSTGSGMTKVLLVEGSADVAGAFALTLERRGMQVVHATSEQEALALAPGLEPDLVVMDLTLVRRRRPGIIGQLRERDRLHSTPLVVYTSVDMSPEEVRRLRAGETVLFLAERSTRPDVQARIVDLLSRIASQRAAVHR